MDLSILANIGTLNSLNRASNPKLNHPILSTKTNTINGFAFSFLLTTCSMLGAIMPSKKNLKTLSAIVFTLKF
jgi:hypothetical protein